tara:strand:+ start:24 stop:491 length:468 start_codon:yes stop_codon:yes gene_type:complete
MNTRSELFHITHIPNIAEATYQNGDLMTEAENILNAVAEPGSCSILQSISAIDKSDTGGTIYLIFTDSTATDLGTVGDAINASDAIADNSMAIVELSNWVDVGGAKVCTKGNIGLVLRAFETSKAVYYGVVNVSGGDIVIGSGEDIIFHFGFVRS